MLAKMQWLQDSHQSNIDNVNNVICQASRHFWNKKKEYLTANIDELETSSEIKHIRDLYRCINHFHKGYQTGTSIVKDEKSDWVGETYSRVLVGKHLSNMFPVKWFESKECCNTSAFHFTVEYAIRRVQVNQDGLKLYGTHQFLVYADGINILGGSIHTIKKSIEALD
jgi:hypothetical protein